MKPYYRLIVLFALFSNITAWSQNPTWTIARSTDFYYSGASSLNDDLPSKKLKEGTKVEGIASYTNVYFQVKLENGEIGFVQLVDIAEAKDLIIEDSIHLRSKDDHNDRGAFYQAKTAKIIKEGKHYVYVELDNGKRGYTPYSYIHPAIKDSIPEINQTARRIIHNDILLKKVVNKPVDEVTNQLGPPSGLWYESESDQNGWIFYRYYTVVKDKKRSRKLWLSFKNGLVTGDSLSKGERFFAERLPLAQTWRKTFDWSYILEEPLYESNAGPSWFDRFQDKNWLTWIIGKLVWIAILVIIFALPSFVLWPVFIILSRIKSLSNTAVLFIYSLVLIFGFYFYMLGLELQVLHESTWFALIGCTLGWVYGTNRYNGIVTYNRCPNCHTMYSASDAGTSWVGRAFARKKVARDVYSHQTSRHQSSNNTTYITNHYDRHWDDEVTRTDKYKDHRHCTVCGYDWEVEWEKKTTKTFYN